MISDKIRMLFMDMDHTLIYPTSGEAFPKDINDWSLIDGVPFVIAKYVEDGYKPVIVSNQGGIKLGHSTEEAMHGKFKAVIQEICRINSMDPASFMYFFCTSNNRDNKFRKPNPGMAEAIVAMYDNVDLEDSIMVGDMDTDEQFAQNAGIGKFIWADEFAKQVK